MSLRYNVFKKHSPNNKIAVYVSRRDVMDDLTKVDPIDGVVTLESGYLNGRKLFARVQCSFRYGNEELDNVMSGVTFKKEFYITTEQIYPATKKNPPNTIVQDRLLERFGKDAIPFSFELPHDIPASISLQSGGSPNQQPCGIAYVLQIYVGENLDSEPQNHSCINLQIRRLTIAIPGPVTQPYTKEMRKDFHLHSGQLKVEASLPREIFYHGESIQLNVVVDNMSSNSVRRMKLQIVQQAEITMFRPSNEKYVILELECDEGFPVEAGRSGWCRTYRMRPTLQDCRQLEGLALDGKSKHEDTNLASSTLIKDYRKKENMAIIVQYFIKLRVVTGFGGRDLEMEIPFILTHPRSEEAKSAMLAAAGDELVIERFKRAKVNLGQSMDNADNV